MSEELLVTGGRRAPSWFGRLAAAALAVATSAVVIAAAPPGVVDGHGTRVVPGSNDEHQHAYQPLRGRYLY